MPHVGARRELVSRWSDERLFLSLSLSDGLLELGWAVRLGLELLNWEDCNHIGCVQGRNHSSGYVKFENNCRPFVSKLLKLFGNGNVCCFWSCPSTPPNKKVNWKQSLVIRVGIEPWAFESRTPGPHPCSLGYRMYVWLSLSTDNTLRKLITGKWRVSWCWISFVSS